MKQAGSLAELRTAKRLGAKPTPASGALQGAKGDMTLYEFKIENKSTVKRSIRLEADWLLKIAQEAREIGKVPALAIQFTYDNGRPRFEPWVMVPERLFRELEDAYRSRED